MLTELHVRDLGVIEDLTLVFGPGMTALTGETGAGKTLRGRGAAAGPGRPGQPRHGAHRRREALVEARFVRGGGRRPPAR